MHQSYYMLLTLFLSLITSACSSEDQLLESSSDSQNVEFRVTTRNFISNESDGQTAQESAIKNLSIKQLRYSFPRLKNIITGGGYRGKLADMAKDFGWELSVVLRPNESSKKL